MPKITITMMSEKPKVFNNASYYTSDGFFVVKTKRQVSPGINEIIYEKEDKVFYPVIRVLDVFVEE